MLEQGKDDARLGHDTSQHVTEACLGAESVGSGSPTHMEMLFPLAHARSVTEDSLVGEIRGHHSCIGVPTGEHKRHNGENWQGWTWLQSPLRWVYTGSWEWQEWTSLQHHLVLVRARVSVEQTELGVGSN